MEPRENRYEVSDGPIADFPRAFRFLFRPSRYKVAYGGRGGAKSWAFARALLIQASRKPLRILCAREIQKTLDESVHQLLKDQIPALGLSDFYEIQENGIYGKNGSSFSYCGLRHNPAGIKSYEGADIAWCEEAQSISGDSLDILTPTIRKEGSELWFSLNPRLANDETYKRYILNPPPNSIVRKIGWQDNPWFPEVLRVEKDHLKATDEKAYLHVWEGECKSAVEGAIYEEELKQAEREGRITTVPYDRRRPVDTYWDLGFGDKLAIWFAQPVGGFFNLLDYLEDSGKAIHHYLMLLQNRGYVYGTDWLPHDGVDAIIHQKLAGPGSDKTKSIEMMLRQAGRKVRIAPKLYVNEGINAVRSIFPQCRFDRTKCAQGIVHLQNYQWGATAKSGAEATKPLHDIHSHGADALRTFALCAKQPEVRRPAPAQPQYGMGERGWMA